MNLTFRMLVNIHFKSTTVILYYYQWGLEPTQKNTCSRNVRRFKRKLSVK